MNKHYNILKWKQTHCGCVNSGDNVSYVHEQLSAESVHQPEIKIMNWPATSILNNTIKFRLSR
jgi:hypothetical protein